MVRASIADGWATFRRHAGLLVGVTLLTVALALLIDFVRYALMTPDYPARPVAEALQGGRWLRSGGWPALLLGMRKPTQLSEAWWPVARLLALPAYLAVPYLQLQLVRGRPDAGLVSLSSGLRRYGSLLSVAIMMPLYLGVLLYGVAVVSLLTGGGLAFLLSAPFRGDHPQLVWYLGFAFTVAAFVVQGFYVTVGVICAPLLVLDRGLGPVDALNTSWALIGGYRLRVLGLGVASMGVVALGALSLGVGLLAALPVVGTAYAAFYDRLLSVNPTRQVRAGAVV